MHFMKTALRMTWHYEHIPLEKNSYLVQRYKIQIPGLSPLFKHPVLQSGHTKTGVFKNVGRIMDDADVQANATGVDQPVQAVRKGRVRKVDGAPRAALAAKKKKEPKAPRNPFRRSGTGKLQLKRMQMSARIESMTPRVTVLRERLETMSGRLDLITGKLRLVNDELIARASMMQPVSDGVGGVTDDVAQ
jgi:hypothetical protein